MYAFTHMMTWTLLGVMAIVQFSAKYLQCNVFFGFFFGQLNNKIISRKQPLLLHH